MTNRILTTVAIWMIGAGAASMSLALAQATPEWDGKDVSVRAPCTCTAETPYAVLEGYVVDAEVTLGADRLSINERQATIIDIPPGASSVASGRTRIWHSNDLKACGVEFDYGKKYSIPVRQSDDGEFETDKCLMDG